MTDRWIQFIGAVVLACLTGIVGWSWAISQRVTIVETIISANLLRLIALESGATGHELAETVARFNAVNIRIDAISESIMRIHKDTERLADSQEALLHRMLDGPKERQ